ncbi:MAG: hypothetical protein IKQ23_01800 [Treponema sp.]|nr:hypothetical protein [Treponema sp.]
MKVEWYCQTKDYKMLTLNGISKLEDKITSEDCLEKFFEDKIILGCNLGKNFIEVSYEEKTLRVSINKKEKFLAYENYNELIKLFSSQYENLLKAENSKGKKSAKEKKISKPMLFELIGFAIIAASFILAVLYFVFFDIASLNKKVAALFLIALGVGLLMTFPKSFDDYENAEGSDSIATRGCSQSLMGFMFLLAGLWIIIF